MRNSLQFFFLITIILSCKQKELKVFSLLKAEETGIDFINTITESTQLNIITEEFLYNGGGVAAGDFNNDGLTDLFFTGNVVENKLYLNEGDLHFQDISDHAGISAPGKWNSAPVLIDINNDGLLDIYVCASIKRDSTARKNMLFINKGVDENGKVSFIDEASNYGIDDESYTSSAAFLDYDNDGDQDLFLLVNSKEKGVQTIYRNKLTDGTSHLTDKLYRNNGDGSFTNVSAEAGILIEGHGLGLSILDINQDGWQDIYIANDFLTNDILYVNVRGKFLNQIDKYIKHQSKFSMGTDAADLNNDGYPDLVTVDMMPKVNNRKKAVIQSGMYINNINDERFNYTHQYSSNMLHLSNGDGSYREVAKLMGAHETEWSWSPLLADFDNDGDKDLLVTNGFPKDITDKDFMNFRANSGRVATPDYLVSRLPSVKVPNFAFENVEGMHYKDVSKNWGFTQPSFSNGAVYADLDNDGDLDYIVSNINDKAFVFKNNINPQESSGSNYLRVKLEGPKENVLALGAKLTLHQNTEVSHHEHAIHRGYISTVESAIHFGLGSVATVDSLVITWPDQQSTILKNLEANQVVNVNYGEAVKSSTIRNPKADALLFQEVAQDMGILHQQVNYDVIDFTFQNTIPHKYSQYGPSLAAGDINMDGISDLVVGSSRGEDLTVFLSKEGGLYEKKSIEKEQRFADGGILLFDADGDLDLDLYVVSAGFKEPEGSTLYHDRLYRNNNGVFQRDHDALPAISSSGSVARACDYDQDGDLDIFVGGRILPHNFPLSSKSCILENTNGVFQESNIDLKNLGMVTDAIWSDYDSDNDYDLLITAEFQPIKILENDQGKLELKENSGLEDYKGWWQSITAGDFDRDGDMDYVAGNYGKNHAYHVTKKRPMFVYALDIDNNNSIDPVLACYYQFADGEYRLAPVGYWEDLSTQSPVFRKRFDSYTSYGRATLDSVLTKDEMARSTVLETNYFYSSYVENQGDGTFTVRPLPAMTQISPVNGIVADYINDDDFLDVVMVGNDYGHEISVGNLDAMNGVVLLGDGKGNFTDQGNGLKGFHVPGDAKALIKLQDSENELIIASQNKGNVKVFQKTTSRNRVFIPQPDETHAIIEYEGGESERREFPFGAGFLSQSSRALILPPGALKATIYSSQGATRTVD